MNNQKLYELNSSVSHTVHRMYLLAFLLGLQSALPAYIFSTFLSQFLPERFVGLAFAASSLSTILFFTQLPKLLRRYGNVRIALSLLIIVVASLIALISLSISTLVVISFIVFQVIITSLIFSFDIFLEHSSRDKVTGTLRGTYLTSYNAAWVIAQIIVAFLLTDSEYWRVFLVAGLITIPMYLLVYKGFKKFHDRDYHKLSAIKLFSKARKNREIINIYIISFLLQFFYAWMVIYTPIYLHNHLGFSWNHIAIMFAVMLLPFVILERPLGKIADRFLGEKELLIFGFITMALATGVMSFISSASFLVWTILLFMSRVGASTVEVMSETYFFKHVHDSDASLIGFFRTTRPWAYIFATIIATIILPFITLKLLFLVLGFIMLYGAFRSFSLKDTQ